MSGWHKDARVLRATGLTLKEIGERFGVSRERVRQVCLGVVCPVDHNAKSSDRLKALWRRPEYRAKQVAAIRARKPPTSSRPEASFVKAHYRVDMTATEIGRHLGITKNAVIGMANRMGLQRSTPAPEQRAGS